MNCKKELHIPVAYINTGVCSSFYVRHNALSYTMLRQSKFESLLSKKISVHLTLNRPPQTEPPQLTRPRHPYDTRELPLSAAVFPP